jgi:hypothetical protein
METEMPTRQTIPSDFKSHPRLAELHRRMQEAPPPVAAASAAEPLDPVWQRAIERAEPPSTRDRVADAPEREPPFSYRTSEDLTRHLPEPARALLRRLDDFATESRDRSVAMTAHVHAAEDRAGRASLDVQAAIRSDGLPEVPDLDAARAMVARDRWPEHYTEPMISHVRRIVAEGDRLAAAQAEVARLRDRQRAHASATAPIVALRERIVRALGRSRPPFRLVTLPAVYAKKAERVLAEAREAVAELTAEIERIENARPNEHEAFMLALAAVEYYAADSGLSAAVKWNGTEFTIREVTPGLSTEDHRPLRPLALLAAIFPRDVAAAIARTIGADPDAPNMKDRPRLLAEARARRRQAELLERAALAAMGDPLDRLAKRSDVDLLLVLMAEASR